MRDLNFGLKQLCRANRDGSYRTQADRERTLAQIADQLQALGYRNLRVHGLKQKHVEALVRVWRYGDEQHEWRPLSVGTTKNRMTALRWWAGKIGKPAVIANSNGHYGIAKRQFVTNESKVLKLQKEALERIADPHVRLSLELQREFGLRAMIARLVQHHVPIGHKKQSVIALEKEAGRVGQLSLPEHRRDMGYGQQQRFNQLSTSMKGQKQGAAKE